MRKLLRPARFGSVGATRSSETVTDWSTFFLVHWWLGIDSAAMARKADGNGINANGNEAGLVPADPARVLGHLPMPRSSPNYSPWPDGNFAAWANQYYDAVEKWWSVNGFDDSELKPLKEALSAWVAAFAAHGKSQAAAEGGAAGQGCGPR